MKKTRLCLLILGAALSMTACGENAIPDMTREEIEMVGEYAAISLMEYDASRRSRLVPLESDDTEDIEDDAVQEDQEDETGMKPVEDTPMVDIAGQQENMQHTLEEIMGLPEQVRITYAGVVLCDKYPIEEQSYFAVTPSEGHKLLVLEFEVDNQSQDDVELDLMKQDVDYRITLNGDYKRKAMITMLTNDMGTYQGILSAGDQIALVLVIESNLQQETELLSVELSAKADQMKYVTTLK